MEFSQSEGNLFRRYGGLSIVVFLHVFVAYVVITDLSRKVVNIIKEPVAAKVVVDITPPPPPEKPMSAPPQVAPPMVPFVPPPEVEIQQPQTVIADVSTVQQPAQPTEPTSPAAPSADQGQAPPIPGFADLNGCKPEYPRASLLAEEAGTVRVQFDVSADARLLGAKIVRSSGFKNLDRAAVNALSRCKFRAAFQNGSAVQSSFVSEYVWTLR